MLNCSTPKKNYAAIMAKDRGDGWPYPTEPEGQLVAVGDELKAPLDELAESGGEVETLGMALAEEVDLAQSEPSKPNNLLRFGLRMMFGAVMHPYEYAMVLMQLGYEPMPAFASTNWLGRSTLFLPGVHQYIRYIRQTDGIPGLYRGLGPRILSNASSALFSQTFVRLIGWKPLDSSKQPFRAYIWNMLRDSVIIATGLGISHPFYVISVRQMAQFVGREITYNTLRSSIKEIFMQEGGLCGFYAGFMPRLLNDLGILFCTSTLSVICNRLLKLKSDQGHYNSALIQFGSVMLLYPLQLVGACMACSGCGLAAGAPPFMPVYGHWIDCLLDLMARGDHYRGAFIFRRTLPKVQVQRVYDPITVSRVI